MYKPAMQFVRTPAECRDQKLSWERSDEAFFAAGACHILAFTLVAETDRSDLVIQFIKPSAEFWPTGTHVYVSDGTNAFDFNGWVPETTLLESHTAACRAQYSDWTYELVTVTADLTTFCVANKHLRPKEFYGDVIARAQSYLATLMRQ